MGIHEIAGRGYELAGEDYERTRPTYPRQAVDLLLRELAITTGKVVLELGAGSGKFTRLLAPTGATILASEPVEAMRRHLVAAAPTARVVASTAEAVPVADSSIDAVVAAMAFHWFRADDALAEASRVLLPEGGLGLVWNNPDVSCGWVDQVWGMVAERRGSAPANRELRWQEAFSHTSRFTTLKHRSFAHGQDIGVDDLVARVTSISFIAALPPAQRDEVLARVRHVATTHPDLAGRELLWLPYRTDVYWCRRR